MPSPMTTRGLLGHFPRGADLPTNNRRTTTLSVRLPAYSSLRAILAAEAGVRRAWAEASGRRATREVGRGAAGGDNSEGWDGESGSSNATLDVESEEGEEEHTSLTALPLGTQESGARELQVGERSGGSGGGKGASGTAGGGETYIRHRAQKHPGRKKGGRRGSESADPWGVGGKSGGREASGVGPNPHGLE